MSMPLKVLLLSKYSRSGASSRLRALHYIPGLIDADFEVFVSPLFDEHYLHRLYRHGRRSFISMAYCFLRRLAVIVSVFISKYDVIWIEKEVYPFFPAVVERVFRFFRIPYVVDYDDAIFHSYDLSSRYLLRTVFGRKIDVVMREASCVIAGNEYLASRARSAGALDVIVIPTVIDINRYALRANYEIMSLDCLPRIVWIGSPSTAKYLDLLRKPLQELALRMPFFFRVIGADFVQDGVQVEVLPWSEGSEVGLIAECDVGVMPLQDSPWERGKCGYKLIQYMACGLPVVGSPVGVNTEIVQDGVNGYLAATDADWVDALERLLTQSALRASLGGAGRSSVETKYCMQVTHGIIAKLLRNVARRN